MPRLSFDPEVGMVAPDSATLRDFVAANWESAFNSGDGSPVLNTEAATPAGQLIDSETMILAQINAELLYLFSQLNPRLAEGIWQDAIGYIYFLTRKIAEPTTVQVTCTGLYGTVIPIGAQIESEDGYRYECTNAVEIPEERTAPVSFQCLEAGPIECPADTLTNFPVYGNAEILDAVTGWKTVRNPSDGITGTANTPTVVTTICGGVSGTVIPSGSRVQTADGTIYASTESIALNENGSATVQFECSEDGPILCPANALANKAVKLADGNARIITVIPGWDMIRNPAPGITGRNKESQVDFENRRFESVAKNSHGAVASLQGALWDLVGVHDCRVLENPGDVAFTGEEPEAHGIPIPGHSVAICIYGGSDEEIAETIYLKKDAGCGTYGNTTVIHQTNNSDYINAVYRYDIWRPTVVPVGIRVIINKTPLTPDGVDTKIKKAVVSDFNGQDPNSGNIRVGLASTVYASRFSVAVVKTAGVQDLVEIKIQLAHNTGTALNPVWEFDNDSWDTSIVLDGKTEPTIIEDDVIVDIRE